MTCTKGLSDFLVRIYTAKIITHFLLEYRDAFRDFLGITVLSEGIAILRSSENTRRHNEI